MNQYSPKFKEFDEPAIYDHEDDMDDLETKPLKLGKKRKYNKNKNKIKDTLKKRRPNVKDVPPDMKIAMADEEGICESRRRVYCDICTKGINLKFFLFSTFCNLEQSKSFSWHPLDC